jgi:hypothetical protein
MVRINFYQVSLRGDRAGGKGVCGSAGDPVHAGDKALMQESPAQRGRVNRYAEPAIYIYIYIYIYISLYIVCMFCFYCLYIYAYSYVGFKSSLELTSVIIV